VQTVVYRSRAVAPLSPPDLDHLVTKSQAHNRRDGITGVMLYDDGAFFQWLEGPRDKVGRLMNTISNDRRHTDIEVLNEKSGRERMFGEWNMKLATRLGQSAPWSDEILEPAAEIVKALHERPGAAPAVLIRLVPKSADAVAQEAPSLGQDAHAPLGRATTRVLKGLIRAVVIPHLADRHGVAGTDQVTPPMIRRAAELADLLLSSDQNAARQLIDELHTIEGSIWPLYASLFEPAARSLGDLWAEDLCSEFDVTLGLCRIQTAARLLTTHAHATLVHGAREAAVLIAPDPGELHRLGAALDSEVLWQAGRTPRCEYPADDKALLDMVSTTWFDALDMSLSAAFRREHRLQHLTKTITDVRDASRNPALLIVVGGRIFAEHQISGAQVGADLTSMTALDVEDLITFGLAKRDETAADPQAS
jgi:hypothetical protein